MYVEEKTARRKTCQPFKSGLLDVGISGVISFIALLLFRFSAACLPYFYMGKHQCKEGGVLFSWELVLLSVLCPAAWNFLLPCTLVRLPGVVLLRRPCSFSTYLFSEFS